jgi:hypothetical protein
VATEDIGQEHTDSGSVKGMSFDELVSSIEQRTVDIGLLDDDALEECVWALSNKGYSGAEIGALIGKDARTVRRYISNYRKRNIIRVDAQFQEKIIGEVYFEYSASFARLLRLSYNEELRPSEQIKAIYLSHQVKKDLVDFLERFGYLSADVGRRALEIQTQRENKQKETHKHQEEELKRMAIIRDTGVDFNLLDPQDLERLVKYQERIKYATEIKVTQMAKDMIAEKQHGNAMILKKNAEKEGEQIAMADSIITEALGADADKDMS